MTDHAAKARETLEILNNGSWTNEQIHAIAGPAQVHATLALAEQQRIANIIALATPQGIPGQGEATVSIPSYSTDGILRTEIAAALGLAPTTPASDS